MFVKLFLVFVLYVPLIMAARKSSRKRRYVAFPEGAAFSAVYCVTSQTGLTDGANIISEGINWGLVYELPNDTRPLFFNSAAVQKRRNRRELYSKVENILASMGYNGKSCILRSLCEATRNFKVREDSLLHHILGLIFRFPQDPVLSHEPDEHRLYHWAATMGKRGDSCSDVFQCPFSLIDMALGHYSGSSNVMGEDVNHGYAMY